MIRQAIEKIQELTLKSKRIEQVELKGQTYTELDLKRVDEYVPKRNPMHLNNLDALISNLKNKTIDKDLVNLPLRINVNEQSVYVNSDLDVNKEVEQLFVVRSQHPDITFNRYISVEEMIIQLQTSFVDTENKSHLINMISNLKKDNTVEMADDGVTQIIKASSGVTSTATVVIPPLVKLTPIRTFFEVEQPEQMFLLRINQIGDVALFDAGGGVWKNDCQVEIRSYLAQELEDYIATGDVVIG